MPLPLNYSFTIARTIATFVYSALLPVETAYGEAMGLHPCTPSLICRVCYSNWYEIEREPNRGFL